MLSSRRARISALLTVVLGLSAWFPLRVPRALLVRLTEGLQLDGEPVAISAGDLRLRWGKGRFEALGLEARSGDRSLLYAARLDLRLDLRPWSGRFLEPRGVDLEGVILGLRTGDLASLRAEGASGELALSGLEVRVRDARASMPLADGRLLELELPEADGWISTARTRLRGRALSPYGLAASFWLEAGAGFSGWTLDLACDDRDLRDRGHLPLRTTAEACALRVRLTAADAVGRVALDGVRVLLPKPELAIELARVELEGSLAAGVRLRAEARTGPLALALRGSLRATGDGGLRLRVDGESQGPWRVDQELLDWIEGLDRTAADVFAALELRGEAPARVALDWRSGAAPEAVGHVPFAGVSAAYRGFLEPDGERPSFPYPASDLAGDFVAAGPRFLFEAAGRAGEGSLQGRGTVLVRRGSALLAIDLRGAALPIDARVTHAVSGTPQASAVWRELGGPREGSADFDLVLRREPADERVRLLLDARVDGTVVRPTFLPIEARAQPIHVSWSPGSARFDGALRTLGGDVAIHGELARTSAGSAPAIAVRARGGGLAPGDAERRVLESFLHLPAGFAELELGGPAALEVDYRRDGEGAASALLAWDAHGSDLRWRPTGTEGRGVRGAVAVARAEGATLVSAPLLQGGCAGGAVELSLLVHEGLAGELPSALVIHAVGVGVEATTETLARHVAGLAPDTLRSWSGAADLDLELDPRQPARHRGSVRFSPLVAEEREGAEPMRVELRGGFQVRDGQLQDGELVAASRDGLIELHDAAIERAAGATTIEANLDTEGIEIGERFAALLSSEAWAAFQRVGLRGKVGADDLRLRLVLDAAGAVFHLAGGMTLREMRVEGPPRMRDGSGRLEVESFRWAGPRDFAGRLHLSGGQAEVAGFALREASSDVEIVPGEVVLRGFDAGLLGGRVRTDAPADADPGAEVEHGRLAFGLTREAPISFVLFLQGISLARVREELRLGGDLAGKVDGRLAFASGSPSPLDYAGEGWLEVRGGVLGTVPVLADMWRVAHLAPPVFDRGRLEFRADPAGSRGRLRVDSFELHHDLLEVRGKGWVGLDSYLNLKATVRTLSILTRLPVISDLVDLLIEQDVYGPMDRPRIRQRALGKVADPVPDRLPFPLWIPALERTDWRLSPAFPAVTEPD